MTFTLSHVVHTRWWAYTDVTPYLDPQHDENHRPFTARHGALAITASNLTADKAVRYAVDHAWPQSASIDIFAAGPSGDGCSASVYLDADHLMAQFKSASVEARLAQGTVTVRDHSVTSGWWRVAVTVWTSSGAIERRCRIAWGYAGLLAPISGFTHLTDFTKITATRVKTDGTDFAPLLTITRTP